MPRERTYADWSATGAGTSSGVTVTKSYIATKTHKVTNIQCSGDAAALVTVESPASTILYRKRFAAAFNMSEQFDTPLTAAAGSDILVKISASTSNSEANMQGYSIRQP